MTVRRWVYISAVVTTIFGCADSPDYLPKLHLTMLDADSLGFAVKGAQGLGGTHSMNQMTMFYGEHLENVYCDAKLLKSSDSEQPAYELLLRVEQPLWLYTHCVERWDEFTKVPDARPPAERGYVLLEGGNYRYHVNMQSRELQRE